MRTKSAWLVGLAAAFLTALTISAQQAVPPDNAPVPEMPKATSRTGKRVKAAARQHRKWRQCDAVFLTQACNVLNQMTDPGRPEFVESLQNG